jgi:ferredoxin
VKRIKRTLGLNRSTLTMWQEGRRTRDYSLLDWLHGYIYGRWVYPYISIGIGEHPAARHAGRILSRLSRANRWIQGWLPLRGVGSDTQENGGLKQSVAATYHGKVVPLQAACQLVEVGEPVRLPDLEKVIPFERARDLILLNPDHIVALDCPCRSARHNPCLPLDVCLIVGEPFASFVSEHHPERTRWISQAEAVQILKEEDDRGHVHHAFFKDAMLGRFYAICNCCSCCCGAMQAHRSGSPMLISSGYIAVVDEDACVGCGTCLDLCQFSALAMPAFTSVVDEQACMGCGICANHCPQEAVILVRAPERGEPLELNSLMAGALFPVAGE